jgi:outer membrane receptor protein involved in Fe transport
MKKGPKPLSVTVFAFLAGLVFLFIAVPTGLGQAETGQIAGKVSDPNGALVANAAVSIKSVNTGVEVTATSNSDGTYTVTNLKPGLYDVTVNASGFAAATQRVQVTVGSQTPVTTMLSVTGTTAQVNVIAEEGVAVNTQNQQLSDVVSSTQLREMPTLTRNPYDFVNLSGNVAADPNGSTTGRGVNVAINGQRAASTNILLDGGENVDTFTAAVGQTVPLDSVQEYRVITNTFSAQYGRATGGIVDVATRSGTNAIHGTGYEFNRISKLASNGFDNNSKGIPKPHFVRNQFGYSIGGPIKKDKLFFFSSTEWTRVRSEQIQSTLVPTADLISASATATQNFFTAFPLSTPINGPVFTVSQIADELGLTLSPTAANAFARLPANMPAFGTVRFPVPTDVGAGNPQNTYQTVGRIDYNWSNNTQLYGRFALDKRLFFPGVINFSPFTGFNTGENDFNQNYNITLSHNFSPTLVATSKIVFNRLNQLQPLGAAPVGPTMYLTGTAFTQLQSTNVALPGYSEFTPGNAIPFGGPQNELQFIEDVNLTHGKHQLTFGGSFIYIQDNRAFGAYENAVEQLGNNRAGGLNNLVLGQLSSFQGAVFPQGMFPGQSITLPVGPPDFTRSNRYRDWYGYINDNWKLNSRFTVNLGLRYDYFGVQHNKNPNLDSNFYLGPGATIWDQIRSGSVQTVPNSPIGSLWKPDKNNFGPRLGFAWDVRGDGKTAFRAGYGISYERNFGNVTFNVIQNPPSYAVVSLTAPGDVPLLPITLDNSGPLAGSSGTKILPPTSLRDVRQDIPTAYAHLWSVSLEHQLFGNSVASIEYSGSKGSDLYTIENLNRLGFGTTFLNSTCINPATGGAVDRLNCQYTNMNTRGFNGTSLYNGLTLGFQSSNFRRHGWFNFEGLQLTARYTYAVARDNVSSTFSESLANFNLGLLDPFNPRLDYGYSDFDVRHRFVTGFNWDLPFAKGSHGWQHHALGGWTVTGTFIARTGLPFTVYDCTFAITVCLRAEMNGPISLTGSSNPPPVAGSPNTFTFINASGLQTGVFQNPNGFGYEEGPYPTDMGRRNIFRGPGFWNLDFGLYKNFHVTERYTLQLRSEFYNVFNHAKLYVNPSSLDVEGGGNVNACFACGATLTGIPFATDRRNIQLALKFIF